MVVILLLLTAIVFLLQKLSHTSPVHAYLGANASAGGHRPRDAQVLGYDRARSRPVPPLRRRHLFAREPRRCRCAPGARSSTDLATYLPATVELAVDRARHRGGAGRRCWAWPSAGRWRSSAVIPGPHDRWRLGPVLPAGPPRHPPAQRHPPLAAGHRRHRLRQRADGPDRHDRGRRPAPRPVRP